MRTPQEMIGTNWQQLLKNINNGEDVLSSSPMVELGKKLMPVWNTMTPKWDNVFKAYELCQPQQLKVLIVGQDPYPTPGHAMGLAFSSGLSKVIPYSLQQIFKDLAITYKVKRTNPDLTDWAKQGVMLLNTCLTTQQGEAFAHKNWGWEFLITKTLEVINNLPQRYVVMAWGKAAQDLIAKHITESDKRMILTAAHPANERYRPGSYVGSQHFYHCNEFLKAYSITPINWIGNV